ncbi:MAG: asparaginase [Geminicoccaceae bacterium]|nr:asparaginase [Geminicoccaceae bacterium]MCX8102539.1 asparaginase [Geminicoccaceae bacterium]MDW8369814.1 asparaginase [Geminicoccaceae bacterium]
MVAIAIEVWRGDRVESRHRASLAVADRAGRLLLAVGEVDRPVYPRSAIKPLQALPLVESGAADAFGLGDAELALACASHGGEPEHLAVVRAWLDRIGLDASRLACGAHPPLHGPTAERLLAAGGRPTRLHNNCSGKHTGMLTLARHLGAPLEGYARPEHPVQVLIRDVLAALADGRLETPPAIDGCGVPTWAIPLSALATAFARFAAPDDLPPPRAAAARRIARAMLRHPVLVAGTGRLCTALLEQGGGLLAKTGAEGVYVAALPERGLGLALKVEDGAARAAEPALLAALAAMGWLPAAAATALEPFARPILRNHAGEPVGRILPVPGWPVEAAR